MFVEQLINGITLGSIYAIVALGYTLVFGVLDIINMAHGEIFMFGAFIGMVIVTKMNAPLAGVPAGAGRPAPAAGADRGFPPGPSHQHDRRLHPPRKSRPPHLRRRESAVRDPLRRDPVHDRVDDGLSRAG